MIKLDPFCFCTNNVPGNDLRHALDLAAECGFRYVEAAAIDGISEQISADRLSDAYVNQIRQELDSRGLVCYALSGHCDMTQPDQFARLLKKIEIAGAIGAKVVNTRSGPPARREIFEEHVRVAAELADRCGVKLHLESYGDIVGPARDCGPVLRSLEQLNVGYTYDAGNTFRYTRGEICIHEDLHEAARAPDYLHMKDTGIRDGWIYNDPIGKGSLDIPQILLELERLNPVLPCSLELPLSFRVNCETLAFDFLQVTDETVRAAVQTSVEYLRSYASFSLQ